jgi:hypothetical protein
MRFSTFAPPALLLSLRISRHSCHVFHKPLCELKWIQEFGLLFSPPGPRRDALMPQLNNEPSQVTHKKQQCPLWCSAPVKNFPFAFQNQTLLGTDAIVA